MSCPNHSYRGTDEDLSDPIERDWERVRKDFPPTLLDGVPPAFDPDLALSCAKELANVKSEEEALRLTMAIGPGYQAFLTAAQLAYPYLPIGTKTSLPGLEIPYVSLARAVESLLTDLKPKLVRPPS